MTKKVFLIEDNQANMILFRTILKLIPDIEIFEETKGDSGLELIKSGNPDVIILDIQLPKMNGIEICKELRKIDKFKNVPMIAITAFAMKSDKDKVLAAGFNEYVTKPIKVKEFKKIVVSYLS